MSCLAVVLLAAAAAEPSLKYVGCFADKGSSRDFSGDHQIDEDDMTAGVCRKHCSTADGGKPFRYMALQDSNQCFCGNSYGKHGSSSKCVKRCRGGATSGVDLDTCGGTFANQVYEILVPDSSGSTSAIAAQIRRLQKAEYDAVPLGCFADKSPGRDFSDEHLLDSEDMTVTSCKKHCVEVGPTRYFAVQDGNQCFCGNDRPGKHGDSPKCTKDCRGGATADNPGGKCGGPFANQAYEIRQRVGAHPQQQQQQQGGCGVPAAVAVSCLVVLFTAVGDHSFCCTLLMVGGAGAPEWVVAGSVAARCFNVALSALLGNIVPDSHVLSPAGLRWASAAGLVLLGMLQVVRSFRTAGRDQDDRRDELRWAAAEVGQKAGLSADDDSPAAMVRAFTTCVLAEWGGAAQVTVVVLAVAVDVRSVIAGGVAAQVFATCVASVCASNSALLRNSSSLRLNFAAGMMLFFVAMNHIFEVPESR
eukprot:TRINITY_DN3081_c2_g1_i2.p1 TRINITY_DN3081_c2_g1~~TRINITY_DN3081_c2_g1_i2.p1  ORF type:complete len:474 (+),score=181.41 TRINITY_DN3081_c2_g1_i2:81-1502(+)